MTNIGKKTFTATIEVVITANTQLNAHVQADEVAKMIRKATGNNAQATVVKENKTDNKN